MIGMSGVLCTSRTAVGEKSTSHLMSYATRMFS